MKNKQLSHTDTKGKANMVDVGGKPQQLRKAVASGFIELSAATLKLIRDNEMKKGDVLSSAQFAGIQAAKQTPSLIPLCHPLLLTKIDVNCTITKEGVEVIASVQCIGQTGVEMEALTAVSVALLTIYDMCKAVDKKMVISDISLLQKEKQDL
jgi:cyclic pyranopterin phosphate synthase